MASFDYILLALGNPGIHYEKTRHNLGFMLAERLMNLGQSCREATGLLDRRLARCFYVESAGKMTLIVTPQAFMNKSGDALLALRRRVSFDLTRQLVVAYDDLDLALGSIRLRAKGSAGTHNGMKSVLTATSQEQMPRLRLGIGPKPESVPAEKYVLDEFKKSEWPVVETVLDKSADLWQALLEHGIDLAISKYQSQIK